MHGGEATGGIIDFLSESSRLLICIDFFDVARASTSAPGEVTNITPSAFGNSSHRLNYVHSGRATPSPVRLPHDLRLTQPPLQQCAGVNVSCIRRSRAAG